MAHLALLIGVGHGPLLKGLHRPKSPLERLLKILQLLLAEGHAAHIKPQSQGLVVPKQLAKPLPLVAGGGWIQIGDGICHAQGATGGETSIVCWATGAALPGVVKARP